MCLSKGCKFEGFRGDCKKPENEICPLWERKMEICENCEENVWEEDLQEVRLKGTRTNLFVCEECSEDIENFRLVL